MLTLIILPTYPLLLLSFTHVLFVLGGCRLLASSLSGCQPCIRPTSRTPAMPTSQPTQSFQPHPAAPVSSECQDDWNDMYAMMLQLKSGGSGVSTNGNTATDTRLNNMEAMVGADSVN